MPRNKNKAKQMMEIQKAVTQLLKALGRDVNHVELKRTPYRVAKMLYKEVCEKVDKSKLIMVSPYEYTSAITILNHRTYTRCPHHLERVELDVSMAYIPDGLLLGASKLPRIADWCSSGLMLQEELTDLIAETIEVATKPKGVAVHVVGRHMCIRARGVESNNSEMITTCLKGVYFSEESARNEFFATINSKQRGGVI